MANLVYENPSQRKGI